MLEGRKSRKAARQVTDEQRDAEVARIARDYPTRVERAKHVRCHLKDSEYPGTRAWLLAAERHHDHRCGCDTRYPMVAMPQEVHRTTRRTTRAA